VVKRTSDEISITVVAPVRDMYEQARKLVEALAQQTVPRERFELILADDGSTSDAIAALASPDEHVRVLSAPRANAYAARNRAVAAARGSIIASCDADCVPAPGWLEYGTAALERADVVAGAIRFIAPNRPTIWALMDMSTFLDQERAVKSGYALGGNLFFRRELFERVGGFDDSQPNQGDYDFVRRCVAANSSPIFVPEAVVWHPTRNRARSFLRKLWAVNRRYAERESAAGRRPEGLKLRNWVPIVQTVRARRRVGRPIGLDRERLAESGIKPGFKDHVRALPLIYLVVPYASGLAQVQGWVAGRRRRRTESFERARPRTAEPADS
jgi:glycosyltransferase involved in cell wall biosynthesis